MNRPTQKSNANDLNRTHRMAFPVVAGTGSGVRTDGFTSSSCFCFAASDLIATRESYRQGKSFPVAVNGYASESSRARLRELVRTREGNFTAYIRSCPIQPTRPNNGSVPLQPYRETSATSTSALRPIPQLRPTDTDRGVLWTSAVTPTALNLPAGAYALEFAYDKRALDEVLPPTVSVLWASHHESSCTMLHRYKTVRTPAAGLKFRSLLVVSSNDHMDPLATPLAEHHAIVGSQIPATEGPAGILPSNTYAVRENMLRVVSCELRETRDERRETKKLSRFRSHSAFCIHHSAFERTGIC